MTIKKFKHVDYNWEEAEANACKGDEVELLLYRSNILGRDLRITNYGGGNTSCRTTETDPLSGEEKEVMWIKGSGGDIGTLQKSGLASLYVDRLRNLENTYQGLEDEDRMVGLLQHCIYDFSSKAPSIDTPLHGFLPFTHIDHLHPDAIIAIAAAKDGEALTQEIWGGSIAWLPWQRPGFDLGLQLRDCLAANPGIRGIILGSHGLFTWGETSYDCYINSLEVIEMASEFIETKIKENGQVFGGDRTKQAALSDKGEKVAFLAPILRGFCSSANRMVGHFNDSEKVLQFVNSKDMERLAPMGTSCPDHFLRTKIKPLIVSLEDIDFNDMAKTKSLLKPLFEAYRKDYESYYNTHKRENSPAIRDANPVIILIPGLGMYSFAKNKQTARVASEFYMNAINVMRGAEAVSTYTNLPRQEAFDIEYWLLEEAKLKRQPKEKPLSRRIALITGGGGGIGRAIADKLVDFGAVVVLADIVEERLEEAVASYSKDEVAYFVSDVTQNESIQKAVDFSAITFGGLDIVVHCAGLAKSKSLTETTLEDWELLQQVIVRGQYELSQKAVDVFRKQDLGGDIIGIASKNGMVAGPNNVAYGSAKAAQQHMVRLLAAELGGENIRVNAVNPDGVIIGSKIWEGAWAEGRAKTYGITVEELPAFYAKRNLLGQIIYPKDIANGVYALLATLTKTTGSMINVDGGLVNAFVR